MGIVGTAELGAVLGVGWSDVAVGGALMAAIAAFVGALALTMGRGRRPADDEEFELPLAG